jgi:hypothetical protein
MSDFTWPPLPSSQADIDPPRLTPNGRVPVQPRDPQAERRLLRQLRQARAEEALRPRPWREQLATEAATVRRTARAGAGQLVDLAARLGTLFQRIGMLPEEGSIDARGIDAVLDTLTARGERAMGEASLGENLVGGLLLDPFNMAQAATPFLAARALTGRAARETQFLANPNVQMGSGRFRYRGTDAVENAKLTRASPQEWLNYLRKQPMPADEVRRLEETLSANPARSLTRDEVLTAVRESEPRLTETVRGERLLNDEAQALKQKRAEFLLSRNRGMSMRAELSPEDRAELARLDEQIARLQGGPPLEPPKYASYGGREGTNYREITIQLGNAEPNTPPVYIVESDGIGYRVRNTATGDILGDERGPFRFYTEERAGERADALNRRDINRAARLSGKMAELGYVSAHWPEKNVLVHIRSTDHVLPDGTRVRKIQEIQSDWGQAAREHGVKNPGTLERRLAEIDAELDAARLDFISVGLGEGAIPPAMNARIRELEREREVLHTTVLNTTGRSVPDAPFIRRTDDYVQLALARIIDDAQADGVQRIAFTTLEEQAARYPGLSESQRAGMEGFYGEGGILQRNLQKFLKRNQLPGQIGRHSPNVDALGGTSYIDLTPETAERIRTKGVTLGHVQPQVMTGLAGAGVGGTAGATQGETPEERATNALVGALAGLGVGAALPAMGGLGEQGALNLRRLARANTEHLLPEEMETLLRPRAGQFRDDYLRVQAVEPTTEELRAGMLAGQVGRNWYQDATRTFSEVFGGDASRAAALTSSYSPRTGVNSNIGRMLNLWERWIQTPASQRHDPSVVLNLFRQSGPDFDTYRGNALRALTTEDPAQIVLSGPKVRSFFPNLSGDFQQVTNDTRMAQLFGIPQELFGGGLTLGRDRFGSIAGTSGGYLAATRAQRAAAKGLDWVPASGQSSLWTWAGNPGNPTFGTEDIQSLLAGPYAEQLRRMGYTPPGMLTPPPMLTHEIDLDALSRLLRRRNDALKGLLRF